MRFLSRRDEAPTPPPVASGPVVHRESWEIPDRPLTAVLMTMARDEGDMLAAWVRHHAALVGIENLIVLDDNSVDGSADALGCTVHHLPRLEGPFTRTWMRLVSGLAAGLLHAYDYVVYLDADEFLVLDPAVAAGPGSLDAFLRARGCPEATGVVGLNVVHTPGEPVLDLTRPILDQRAHAIFAPGMCKPSIKRVPTRWGLASHGLAQRYAPDPGAFMLHLKFADRDRLIRIAESRHTMFLAEGRARASTWSREADELVGVLDEVVVGLDTREVAEFDPATIDLPGLITDDEGVFRPIRQGQLEALRLQQPTRIPTRLKGLA